MESCSERECYLPHHPVDPNKPGKVLRVLNGATQLHGAYLNMSFHTGHDLLQNLINVILRFRRRLFTISANIKETFLQVGMLRCDQSSLRFLWREDPSSYVVVHQYKLHNLRAKDSPIFTNMHDSARHLIMLSGVQKPEKTSLKTSTLTTF